MDVNSRTARPGDVIVAKFTVCQLAAGGRVFAATKSGRAIELDENEIEGVADEPEAADDRIASSNPDPRKPLR
jgi:hypothetical protein